MKRELALMTALLVGGAAAQSQAVLPIQSTDLPAPDAATNSVTDGVAAAITAADIPALPLSTPALSAPISPAAMPAVEAPLAELLGNENELLGNEILGLEMLEAEAEKAQATETQAAQTQPAEEQEPKVQAAEGQEATAQQTPTTPAETEAPAAQMPAPEVPAPAVAQALPSDAKQATAAPETTEADTKAVAAEAAQPVPTPQASAAEEAPAPATAEVENLATAETAAKDAPAAKTAAEEQPATTKAAPAKTNIFGFALPKLPAASLPELPELPSNPAQQSAAKPATAEAEATPLAEPEVPAQPETSAQPDVSEVSAQPEAPAETEEELATEVVPWTPTDPVTEVTEFVASDGVLTQTTLTVEPVSIPQAEQPQTVIVPAQHLPTIQTSAPIVAPEYATGKAANAGSQQAQAFMPSATPIEPEAQPIDAPETLPEGWRYMKGQLTDAGLSALPAGAKIQLAIEAIDRVSGLHSAHLVVGYGSDALPAGYYLNYNAGRLNTAQYDYVVKAKVFDASGHMLHMSNAYELPTQQAVIMDMDLGPATI